jgi:uroporphyrinogen-III synthase
VFAPALQTVPMDDGETVLATRALIEDPPDYLLATTGVGTRMWLAVAQAAGLDSDLRTALKHTRIVARGPKSRGALHQHELPPWRSEPTEQLDGAVDHLLSVGVEGITVAVQLYGTCVPDAVNRLEEGGARIIPVPVYRWGGPPQDDALRGLVRDVTTGRVAAVTFTSAPAVNAFFAAAARTSSDIVAAFNTRAVAAAVGPVTGALLATRGVSAPCFPDPGRLGLMVRAVSARLQTTHRHFVRSDGGDVVNQGTLLADVSTVVDLTPREQQLFAALAIQPRKVASRPALLREVWGREQVDPSAVDTVVRRLRQRIRPLGLDIRFVSRRGFALDADEAPCPSG